MADRQAADRVFRLGTVDVQFHFLTHHHLGQAGFGGFGSFHCAHIFALAQNGHAVRDVKDLMEFMGDNDNRLAVRLHVAHDGKEFFGLLRGQDGCRLIEDENIRAAVEHLDNFKRLLLADAHLIYLLIKVQRELVLFTDGTRLIAHGTQVELLVLVHAQGDIFHSGKNIHKLKVLVNHADAQCQGITRGTNLRRLAVDPDNAGIRVINTGDHIHQRCLAGAVFAQQGQNFTPANLH